MAERFIQGQHVTLRHGWGGNKRLRDRAITQRLHDTGEMKHHPEPAKFDITGTARPNPGDYALFHLHEEI